MNEEFDKMTTEEQARDLLTMAEEFKDKLESYTCDDYDRQQRWPPEKRFDELYQLGVPYYMGGMVHLAFRLMKRRFDNWENALEYFYERECKDDEEDPGELVLNYLMSCMFTMIRAESEGDISDELEQSLMEELALGATFEDYKDWMDEESEETD